VMTGYVDELGDLRQLKVPSHGCCLTKRGPAQHYYGEQWSSLS